MSARYSQTAQEYLNRGNAKIALQAFKGAISDYTKAIEVLEAYYYRGITKDNLQDFNGAIDDFTKVIELFVSDTLNHWTMGPMPWW